MVLRGNVSTFSKRIGLKLFERRPDVRPEPARALPTSNQPGGVARCDWLWSLVVGCGWLWAVGCMTLFEAKNETFWDEKMVLFGAKKIHPGVIKKKPQFGLFRGFCGPGAIFGGGQKKTPWGIFLVVCFVVLVALFLIFFGVFLNFFFGFAMTFFSTKKRAKKWSLTYP